MVLRRLRRLVPCLVPAKNWYLGAEMKALREVHVVSLGTVCGTACRTVCGTIVGAALFAATAAQAQDYPTRPIRVISPFPAGSASDTVGRVVVDAVQQIIGQPMVVEARPGGGGRLGFADA